MVIALLIDIMLSQTYSSFEFRLNQMESTNNNFNDTLYGESGHNILILLDCDSTMFERHIPNDHESQSLLSSPMEISLAAISHLFQTKMRMDGSETGMRGAVGVLLFGSDAFRLTQNRRDEQNSLPSTSTYELVTLSQPGIQQIMTIEACKRNNLESTSAIGQLHCTTKEADECLSLKSVLYEANEIFMRAKFK